MTTTSSCYVIAVDELPGGTAADYSQHICESVDHLASVHSAYTESDLQSCRKTMIGNISNCMTDRVAANHAAIQLVNEAWDKTLTELNCHLHPLDTIANSARSALHQLETSKGRVFGTDCFAGNIVLQMNKMHYKDGKGDPRGFKEFLDSEELSRGLIPRYRGNRLHVLFHICGKYHQHYQAFLKFLQTGTVACGGLREALAHDFQTEVARAEMHVLGLFGKLLTGPWMTTFYTSADLQVSHVEGIQVVKSVLTALKLQLHNPAAVLSSSCNFLGGKLDAENDSTLRELLQPPDNMEQFSEMVKPVLMSCVTVLERTRSTRSILTSTLHRN